MRHAPERSEQQFCLPFSVRIGEQKEHIARIGKLAGNAAPPQFLLRSKARHPEACNLHRDLRRIKRCRPCRAHILRSERPESLDLIDPAAQLLGQTDGGGEASPPLLRHLCPRCVE